MMPQSSPPPASGFGDTAAAGAYRPIRDYALIGDCHGAALVSTDGRIDWCCLGRFDADPVFWRLLDAQKGGFFSLAPQCAQVERSYRPGSNILESRFSDGAASARLTDFMPVGRQPGEPRSAGALNAPGWIVRVVEGLAGTMTWEASYRFAKSGFGRGAKDDSEEDGLEYAIFCEDGPLSQGQDQAWFTIAAGERRVFVLAPAAHAPCEPARHGEQLLEITEAFWKEWRVACWYQGPYAHEVERSMLVLKMLTYAPTGAVVAAPTTSLPEELGGARNWDYRYAWLRDSAFVLQALAGLGFTAEAAQFCDFQRLCCVRTLPALQVLYGIGGEARCPERVMEDIDGYAESRPVRIGNAACEQRQIDIYGELLDWALGYWALGESTDATQKSMIRGVADFVAENWHWPDQGFWERRDGPRHYVNSKIMAYVALDRAIRILGPNDRWQTARDAIWQVVMTQGVADDQDYLVGAFGAVTTDAALLQVPMLGLPIDQDLLLGTVAVVERTLREGDYVHRYRTADGLAGPEGAFLLCSFWLVDALLVLDRAEEARALYERLLQKASPEGLYGEEIDTQTNDFLGNFPQAFTHVAVVNSALHLRLYEEGGSAALAGTAADRLMRIRAIAHSQEQALGPQAAASFNEAQAELVMFWGSDEGLLSKDSHCQAGENP